MALEKCVKITHKTLFDQKYLVFQKLELVLLVELVFKLPKVLVIIVSLKLHFKVVVQVVYFKKIFSRIQPYWVLFWVACEIVLHSNC